MRSVRQKNARKRTLERVAATCAVILRLCCTFLRLRWLSANGGGRELSAGVVNSGITAPVDWMPGGTHDTLHSCLTHAVFG